MNLNYTYLFILLFLIILYIFIKLYDGFPYVKKDQDYNAFLEALDNYYVTNISYELFIFVIYILSYFMVFLLFRIKLLGTELSVMVLGLAEFNFSLLVTSVCVNAVLFLLCVIFYINIINALFYPTIIRLHYYFYQFEWYGSIIDYCHMEFSKLSDKMIFPLYDYLSVLGRSMEKFKEYYDNDFEMQRIINSNPEELQKQLKKLEIKQEKHKKLWAIVHNNKLFLIVIKVMVYILCRLQIYASRMLYSASYPILLLILLYDIHKGVFYYIYYGLFGYFCVIWIKKIRYFLSVKDPIEKWISVHFYTNEVPYHKVKQLFDNNDIQSVYKNIGQNTKAVLEYKDEMIKYFLDNFTVYHVMYPIRKANEKYIRNDINRMHILILIIMSVIYYYYNSQKYHIILFQKDIPIYIITLLSLVLLYYVHPKILYDTEKVSEESCVVWAENKYYKRIFYGIICCMTIPMLYIMLKNKLTIFPNEILLEIGGYIKVVDNYTIKQKIKYLGDYLAFLKNVLKLPEEHWVNIMIKVNKEIIIEEKLTLAEIRQKVENLISMWVEDYKVDRTFDENPLVKILNKIKNVFKK